MLNLPPRESKRPASRRLCRRWGPSKAVFASMGFVATMPVSHAFALLFEFVDVETNLLFAVIELETLVA